VGPTSLMSDVLALAVGHKPLLSSTDDLKPSDITGRLCLTADARPLDITNFSNCKKYYFLKFLTFTKKHTYCIHIYTEFIYNHIFTITNTFT
jgi:hypothetical protein